MGIWNPWHGCQKISEGCLHCYMYRRDAEFNKDSTIVTKTATFNAPVKRRRDGSYAMQESGYVYACMTSDFFIEEADEWRKEAWLFIRQRQDLKFFIITKRIHRFEVSLPSDWGSGYENVTICATCENQKRADERLPVLLNLPIKHKEIIHEPMLESIDIYKCLESGQIEKVVCGGESGPDARVCNFDWILNTREQCRITHTPFHFKQTGAKFVKNGKLYCIKRKYQSSQAHKANIDLLF